MRCVVTIHYTGGSNGEALPPAEVLGTFPDRESADRFETELYRLLDEADDAFLDEITFVQVIKIPDTSPPPVAEVFARWVQHWDPDTSPPPVAWDE